MLKDLMALLCLLALLTAGLMKVGVLDAADLHRLAQLVIVTLEGFGGTA